MEETHNTLKFAHRAKRVTIQATANHIIDERSLIRKYQKEILCLKEELDQLKRQQPKLLQTSGDNSISVREQLEAGQVELLSRLEDEEQAKAALLGRIQRLTKLILVSSKNNTKSQAIDPSHRRRHSYGEEKKYENFDLAIQTNGFCTPGRLDVKTSSIMHNSNTDRVSIGRLTQKKDLITNQMDLLRGRLKMQAGEVANYVASLRNLSKQVMSNPDDLQLQVEMEKTKTLIQEKEEQLQTLEQQIIETVLVTMESASPSELLEVVSNLISQLNRKEYEFEIKAVDFQLLQEELRAKLLEIQKLQAPEQHLLYDTILEHSITKKTCDLQLPKPAGFKRTLSNASQLTGGGLHNYACLNGECKDRGSEADYSDSETYSSKGSSHFASRSSSMQSQMLMQAAEIDSLKQEKVFLREENGGLQIQCQKLAEEAAYARELASAAAVELRNLTLEVTKLSFENSKLSSELSSAKKDDSLQKPGSVCPVNGHYRRMQGCVERGSHTESPCIVEDTDSIVDDIELWNLEPEDLKMELYARKERERYLKSALTDKEQTESELRKKLEEGKKREADLENDLAGMWVQLAMLRKEKGMVDYPDSDASSIESCESLIRKDIYNKKEQCVTVDLQKSLEEEKQRTADLQTLVSQLKSEELECLQLSELEELQKLHVEALTKLFQVKAKCQDKERDNEFLTHTDQQDDERNSHICKICFEAPTAAVLLPCRHFCLCKPCAVACTECPLCRSGIADRIITFTS